MIEIFLDTADLKTMEEYIDKYDFIGGVTINGKLMSKCDDYSQFQDLEAYIDNVCCMFESVSFQLPCEVENNVYRKLNRSNLCFKIPATESGYKKMMSLRRDLSSEMVIPKFNLTAVMNSIQLVPYFYPPKDLKYVSFFYSRSADADYQNDAELDFINDIYEDSNVEIIVGSLRTINDIKNILIYNNHRNGIILTLQPHLIDQMINEISSLKTEDEFDEAYNTVMGSL